MPRSTDVECCRQRGVATKGRRQLLMTAASSSEWHAFLRAAQEHSLDPDDPFLLSTLLRRDLDGGLKIAQDALCEAMSLNDNRVMEIHLYKALDRDNLDSNAPLALATPLPPGIRQRSRRSNRSFLPLFARPLPHPRLRGGKPSSTPLTKGRNRRPVSEQAALILIVMLSLPCFSYVLLGMQMSTP